MPRVSVAMPVFNGEAFIADALDSILAQDYEDFELIITDNASTDATEAICNRYAARDERIRYYRHPKNVGAARNFNSGFKFASGEYFKWCAHDDVISRNYLSECVRALDADPHVALAFGRPQCIDEQGAGILPVGSEIPNLDGLSPSERFGRVIRFPGTSREVFGVFRMSVLKRTSLHRLYYGSDQALLAETALLGKFARTDKAVFFNREHPARSIRIDDKCVRREWQSAEAGANRSYEHLSLLGHLWEIAGGHREIARRRETYVEVIGFAFIPLQMSRYALELVGAISPSLQRWARRAGYTLKRIS